MTETENMFNFPYKIEKMKDFLIKIEKLKDFLIKIITSRMTVGSNPVGGIFILLNDRGFEPHRGHSGQKGYPK